MAGEIFFSRKFNLSAENRADTLSQPLVAYFSRILYTEMSELPVYSRSQLALRNGQDKPEVWIAYKGLIYDVSRSRLWFNGKHYEHWAGQDLTTELADAPHDEWVFEHFDAIGRLA